MQNTSRKHSALESFFKEVAEIASTALVSQGGLPVNILELSTPLQKGLT